MDKKLLAFVAGFAALVAAASAYIYFSPQSVTPPAQRTDTPTNPVTDTSESTPAVPTDTPAAQPAQYVDYSADAFAADSRTKVLFFYASWCPKCRALDTDITSNLGSLRDVTIYKIDYDSATELRKQYGVTLQTTLVKTDAEGNKLSSFVAYDEPTLAAMRQALAL